MGRVDLIRWRVAALAFSLVTIPSAALPRSAATIFDDALNVCAAVVFDRAAFDAEIGEGRWLKTSPRAARSTLAVRAWRAMALRRAYLVELPNGGCSIFVMDADADADALKRAAVDAINVGQPFEPAPSSEARDGAGTRAAYCTSGAFAYVASITTPNAERGDVAFTLFRASGRGPSFRPTPQAAAD